MTIIITARYEQERVSRSIYHHSVSKKFLVLSDWLTRKKEEICLPFIIIPWCWGYNFYLCIINNHFTFLKVFEIDDVKAWKSVLISVTSYALGLFMISKAPWYLLLLAWAWTGTAVTGVSSIHIFSIWLFLTGFSNPFHSRLSTTLFPVKILADFFFFWLSFVILFPFFATQFFVIGHDCAHKSFSSNKLVEDIIGTLAFLPLIYPYEPWRFKHDKHHAKTNM